MPASTTRMEASVIAGRYRRAIFPTMKLTAQTVVRKTSANQTIARLGVRPEEEARRTGMSRENSGAGEVAFVLTRKILSTPAINYQQFLNEIIRGKGKCNT